MPWERREGVRRGGCYEVDVVHVSDFISQEGAIPGTDVANPAKEPEIEDVRAGLGVKLDWAENKKPSSD